MTKEQPQGIIVGAGVSGLIAATELEQAGWSVTLVERSDHLGGRVATTEISSWPLDEGFQVLLTGYPHVQKYLDLDALDLRTFLPGAACFRDDGTGHDRVGDPLRAGTFLGAAFSSEVASWSDKWRLLKWIAGVRRKSIDQLFTLPERSTRELLDEKGFSSRFVARFLHPFLAGIFLDTKLITSSRMCEFVMKMFAEGKAVIPGDGMGAIPGQLGNALQNTTFKTGTPAKEIGKTHVVLESGERLEGDAVILAHGESSPEPMEWGEVHTLYYETGHSGFGGPLLGLFSYESQTPLINNIHFLRDLFPQHENNVVSVTVIESGGRVGEELERAVVDTLGRHNIPAGKLLYHTHIRKALPRPASFKASPSPTAVDGPSGLYLAGDYLTNPSLQGAMESGRIAANSAIKDLGQRQTTQV